jgi:hypothetical protein
VYESGALDSEENIDRNDPDLTIFGAQMYDAQGAPTPFAWRAASIDESGLLPYLSSRTGRYPVAVPAGAVSPLTVDLALRFRSLSPQGIRDVGLEEILPLEIFHMWTERLSVEVVGGF